MPRIKTNPFLLMPELKDVGSMKAVEQQGKDFIETVDQIDPDYLGDQSLHELNDFVDIMRGERD